MTSARTWRGAGLRTGADPSKVRLALVGWMLVVPTLIVGGLLGRLVVPMSGHWDSPLGSLAFGPLRQAWRADRDAATFVTLGIQLLLLALLAAFFHGALHRLAAVELSTGVREGKGAGLRFAARRLGRIVRTRLGLALIGLGPVLLALLFVGTGASGASGTWWFVVVATLLAVLVVGGLLALFLGAFAPLPAIAIEDVGARAALVRAVRLVRARPARIFLLRVGFLASAFLSTLLRLIPALLLFGLTVLLLRLLGPAFFNRALAVFQAGGIPADADRLGLTVVDVALAGVLAVGVAGLCLGALAHFTSRLIGVRTALFLLLRQEVEDIAPTRLEPPAEDPQHLGPEAAGFRLQGRLSS